MYAIQVSFYTREHGDMDSARRIPITADRCLVSYGLLDSELVLLERVECWVALLHVRSFSSAHETASQGPSRHLLSADRGAKVLQGAASRAKRLANKKVSADSRLGIGFRSIIPKKAFLPAELKLFILYYLQRCDPKSMILVWMDGPCQQRMPYSIENTYRHGKWTLRSRRLTFAISCYGARSRHSSVRI